MNTSIIRGLLLLIILPSVALSQIRQFPVHLFDDSIYYGPMDYVEHDGELYVGMRSLENGSELYKFDGDNLTRLTDINPDAGHSVAMPGYSFGSYLYFSATDNGLASGSGLYRTAGVAGDWERIEANNPDVVINTVREFVELGGWLYFVADTTPDLGGITLLRTNGTTTEVADPDGPELGPRRLTVLGDRIVFLNSTLSRVWAFDGTEIVNIGDLSGGLRSFVELDGWLYFGAERSVWRTDGTNINRVTSFGGPQGSFPELMVNFDGWIWASVQPGPGFERAIWRSDGTTSEIVTSGRFLRFPEVLGDYMYFTGAVTVEDENNLSTHDLWRTDGTSFEEVADIWPGASSSSIEHMTTFNGSIYFRANDGINGHELWRTDGTTTEIVHDLRPGFPSGFPGDLFVWNTKLIMVAADARFQNHLSCLGCPSGLPVELSSFDVNLDGDTANLVWTTSSERNNAGFEIQHAEENLDFKVEEFIEGSGSSTEQQSYAYNIENLNPGHHRFRLKQLDFDGAFEYSDVIEVLHDIPSALHVIPAYPNPFSDQVTISFAMVERSDVEIEIVDLLGRTLSSSRWELVEGNETHRMNIDLKNLPSGSYLYRVKAGVHSSVGVISKARQ